MANDKDLVGGLPGSSRGDKNNVGVTNHTLMPTPKKLPGSNPPAPKSSFAPAPHLLGSGSKIPESQDSRMRSQFANVDTAKFASRGARPEVRGGSGLTEGRGGVPCSAYKSESAPVASGGKESVKIAEANAKAAAAEKMKVAAEQKRLMGMKEAVLSNVCSNTSLTMSSPEVSRAIGIVSEINLKLGLPHNNMGSWKLPT